MNVDEDGDCTLCVAGICSAHQIWIRPIDDDNNGNEIDGEMIVVDKWKGPGNYTIHAGIASWSSTPSWSLVTLAIVSSSDASFATIG